MNWHYEFISIYHEKKKMVKIEKKNEKTQITNFTSPPPKKKQQTRKQTIIPPHQKKKTKTKTKRCKYKNQ